MPEVIYVPGAMSAIIGEGCLALVDVPPDSPVVAWIWQQFGQRSGVNTVLGGLLAADFAGAENFALLATGGDRSRLYCRGTVTASVLDGVDIARVDGTDLATWSEHVIASEATRIVVGEPLTGEAVRLPASTGVLLARSVAIEFAAAASTDDSADAVAVTSDDSYPDTLTLTRPGDGYRRPPRPWPALIDSVPWAPSGIDEATVKRGELAAPGGPSPDSIGPLVAALVCQSGHANPPGSTACGSCCGQLPEEIVLVPRPVLGVLVTSLGDVIKLDRGVVMGRNPSAGDFAGDGEERPHVVRLPNTGSDISRTHLRVTLDGWQVLVTDLNSTNGTLVTPPGGNPQPTRPSEPVQIQPGTVVTLADGIDFRYEAAE